LVEGNNNLRGREDDDDDDDDEETQSNILIAQVKRIISLKIKNEIIK